MTTRQDVTTPGLSTGKALLSIIPTLAVSFIIYLFLYAIFITIDRTLTIITLSSSQLSPETFIQLKLLTAFIAISTTMALALPFIFRFTEFSDRNSPLRNFKTHLLPLLVFFIGLFIEYTLFTRYMSGSRQIWVMLSMGILALMMFFIPWYQFIKAYKRSAYRWVAVAFSIVMVFAAFFSAIA